MLQMNLGRQMEDNTKDKKDLEDKITENNRNLQELKRRNQMSTVSNTSAANDKDKDKDSENEVNIEELLKDVTKDIHRIYKNGLEAHADLEAKQPIDILKVSVNDTISLY